MPPAELTNQEIQALRASGQTVPVAFQIGKSGITEGVVKELQTWLGREPLVKVKIMRGGLAGDMDTEAIGRELASRARVRFIEARGHTVLFYRMPRNRRGPDDY